MRIRKSRMWNLTKILNSYGICNMQMSQGGDIVKEPVIFIIEPTLYPLGNNIRYVSQTGIISIGVSVWRSSLCAKLGLKNLTNTFLLLLGRTIRPIFCL